MVSTAQRTQIEKEYDAYRAELRRALPVGRTLDNLVAQASVRIGDTDPIIERLIQDNPGLREPLSSVQATLATARERLELAQRESAQPDPGPPATVNLSVYLSRLERLAGTLKTAQELAEVSARYQEQVEAVQKSVAELEAALNEQMQGYTTKIGVLGEYERSSITPSTELESKEMTKRERLVMELLKAHVTVFSEQRRAETQAWLEEFRKRFSGFSDS